MKAVISFGHRLKQKRINAGLTQEELGKKIGVTKSAISQWEKGKVENIEGNYLFLLAKIFNESVEELMTGISNQQITTLEPGPAIYAKVPLISWIQAGNWCETIDNFTPGDAEEWRETTARVSKQSYALKVKGDSMTNPHGSPSIPEGCIIIVDPNAQYKNGSIVVARLEKGKEATLKKLIDDGGRRYLKALNPAYQAIEITEDCMICGVVKQIIFDL